MRDFVFMIVGAISMDNEVEHIHAYILVVVRLIFLNLSELQIFIWTLSYDGNIFKCFN